MKSPRIATVLAKVANLPQCGDILCKQYHCTMKQSFRWAPTIWKDSGFGIFQEMTQKAGRNSASCQLAFCKKAPPLTTFVKS